MNDIYTKRYIMIQFETLLGIEELSKDLGICKYTIYKKIRENKFPKGVKVNGKRKFQPQSIKEFYERNGVKVTISESRN
jgi:predicted DNA-binding transcriptional regulator AlpA